MTVNGQHHDSGKHRSGTAGQWRAASDNRRGMLPLGMQTFREVRESGAYYVDKTRFAHKMVTQSKCYFLSRPRRFGKSLFIDMLKELFSGTQELFEGLYIHDRWDWSQHRPVVYLSFGSGYFTKHGGLDTSLNAQLRRIQERTGTATGYGNAPEQLVQLLDELHRRSGRRVAVLVDEYDKPILDALETPAVARENRNLLRGFYAAIKDADRHVRFVLLTGVSKFSKVSLFSGLNNLKDITLNPAYSSVCGFTEADLDRVFAAELEGLDREKVREWYNGYSWLGTERVYNPYDMLMLLDEREFKPYWFETGSPKFLIDTLMQRCVPTVTLGDAVSTVELLSAFDVDRITIEALLFQTGYLTITGTEKWDDETYYKLAYPNLEVRKSLHEALLERMVNDTSLQTTSTRRLRRALQHGDGDGLCSLFKSVFANIPYQWHTSGNAAEYESYYASVFYSYFAALGLDIIVEDTTSQGRIDMVIRTPQRIWLFEFKTTRSSPKTTRSSPTSAGMQQIHDRGYPDKYRNHGLPILLVAIEFNPATRSITHYETATINPNPT